MNSYQLDDPDFDQSIPTEKNKVMFIAGMIGGVMVLCTIGFVVLFSMIFFGSTAK